VYNLTAYFDKNMKCVTQSITVTHGTVTGITAMTENVCHKLYIDNFFHLQHHDLCTKTVTSYGTLRPNRKGICKNFGQKVKLKRGDKDQGEQ